MRDSSHVQRESHEPLRDRDGDAQGGSYVQPAKPTDRLTPDSLLSLQRSAGNAAVARLVASRTAEEATVSAPAAGAEAGPGEASAPDLAGDGIRPAPPPAGDAEGASPPRDDAASFRTTGSFGAEVQRHGAGPDARELSRAQSLRLQRQWKLTGQFAAENQGNVIKVTGAGGGEYKRKVGKYGELTVTLLAGGGGQITIGPDPKSGGSPVQPSTVEAKAGKVREGALKACIRAYENKTATGWDIQSVDFEPEIGRSGPEKGSTTSSTGVAVGVKFKLANNVEIVGKLILVKIGKSKAKTDVPWEVQAFAAEGEIKDDISLEKVVGELKLGGDVKATGIITLSGKATLEPDKKALAAEAAQRLGPRLGMAAVETAVEAAAVAGPPLLAAIIIAQGIYMAGEKGKLHANILEGAIDAKKAAFVYAQNMTGSESPGSDGGPRAKAAAEKAKAELAGIAGRLGMAPDELMTELRQNPAKDFSRIHSQAQQAAFSAYHSEVRKVIRAWRSEHYILGIWTREEDDIVSATRKVDVVFSKP